MFCPTCRNEIPDGSQFCPKCGAQIMAGAASGVSSQRPLEKASKRAIACLILGIISLVLCGIPFIIPVILSIIELVAISKQKSSRAGYGYAIAGLAMGIVSLFFVFFFGLMAAIAVPNFLAAKTRSQVSRSKLEMNICATALEAYYIDNNAYPPPDYDNQHQPILPHILTTPISYITKIPIDPFSSSGKQTYHYNSVIVASEDTTTPYWIITGQGPDQKIDIDVTRYNPQDPVWLELNNAPATYDPTNGTTSLGDVWRRGP